MRTCKGNMDSYAIRKKHEVQDDLRAAKKALEHHAASFERLRTGEFAYSVKKLCDDHKKAMNTKTALIADLERVVEQIESGEYNEILKQERKVQSELAGNKGAATKEKKAAARAAVKPMKPPSPHRGRGRKGHYQQQRGNYDNSWRRNPEDRELDSYYRTVERFPAHLAERLDTMEVNSAYQYSGTWFFGRAPLSEPSKAHLLFVHERTCEGEFFLHVFERIAGGKVRVKKFLKNGRDKQLIEDYERAITSFGFDIPDPVIARARRGHDDRRRGDDERAARGRKGGDGRRGGERRGARR